MRSLDRTAVAAPPCLGQYRHGTHTWGDVGPPDKQQIRAHLEQLQGRMCAYCEGPLDSLGQHIEHFRRKHHFPRLTFDWVNLFWSCDRDDSCGRFKDHDAGAYDSDDIIDPCLDSPDRFFRFRSDGAIDVRVDLSLRDEHRARETLRVFNLDPNNGRLRAMRRRALEAYQGLEPDILQALEDFSPAERGAFLAEEVARTCGEPFSSVIRHFFEDIGAR